MPAESRFKESRIIQWEKERLGDHLGGGQVPPIPLWAALHKKLKQHARILRECGLTLA